MKNGLKVIVGLLIVLLIVLILELFSQIKDVTKLEREDIKKIVLEDMNQKASNAHFNKIEKDIEDGKSIYEVELTVNGDVYECEVDATTGTVLEFETEKK